ncbi:MAG TPA: PilC/PilY family type IV pilus protein [Rhodocyclaceae bacterium]
MKSTPFRRIVAWLVIVSLNFTQVTQAIALTLATSPLAATTTSTVRPNLMYVLDDSGSMDWDYAPDYINDTTTAADPGSIGGSRGDGAYATVSGGAVTAILPANGTWDTAYTAGTPTVVIQGGGGTGASASVTLNASKKVASVTIGSGGSGYGASPISTTATGTSATKTITVANATGILPGYMVSGTGISANAFVQSISGTTVTMSATNSASHTNTAVTFTPAPVVSLVGPVPNATWGMCWGTTGTNNAGGIPKDTNVSPTCSSNSQPPYATAAINYMYYDPAVSYVVPIKADGSTYSAAVATSAATDGYGIQSIGSLNLTTGWPHEVWCNASTASPSAADPTAGGKCHENLDSGNVANFYPNTTFNFRKTYTGPASYYSMSPSEYCTDDSLSNCTRSTTPVSSGGSVFNIASTFRWCAYYNPQTHTYGQCQAHHDLTHYIPNYLGGWVSAGTPGVQATAGLEILSVSAGQQLTTVTVGGADVVGGTTFTVGANFNYGTVASPSIRAMNTTTDVAQAVCKTISDNIGTTGYGCAMSGSVAVIEAAVVGAAPNTLPVIASGPSDSSANPSLASFQVTSANTGAQIDSIRVVRGDGTSTELLSASAVQKNNSISDTAKEICAQIKAGPATATYEVRSRDTTDNTVAWGTCAASANGQVEIRRKDATATDDGATLAITGPTGNSGSITVTTTAGATRIDDIKATVGGVANTSLVPSSSKPWTYTDGTATSTIAADIATRINNDSGTSGCTATVAPAGGNAIRVSGTCTGTLTVSATAVAATGTVHIEPSSSTNTAGDLGGLSVSTTAIVGHVAYGTLPNTADVASTASAIQAQINASTSVASNSVGPTNFSAATPTVSGTGRNIVVTAPAGNAYNGLSFSPSHGTAGTAAGGTQPQWSFNITGATTDSAALSMSCNGTTSFSGNTGTSGSASDWVHNLATGFSGKTATIGSGIYAGDYTYNCSNSGLTAPTHRCTVTGPTGHPTCTLAVTPGTGISAGNIVDTTTGGSAPQWTFNISDATTDNKNINSLSCGGSSIFTGTANTGSATALTAAQRIQNLADDLVAKSANGYTFAKISGASGSGQRIRVTGPNGTTGGQPFCNSNLSITKDASITLSTSSPAASPAGSGYSAGAATTYTQTFTGATSDNRAIHSLVCGSTCVWDDGSGSCSSATNSSIAPNTGTTTAPATYATTLASNMMGSGGANFDPDGGSHWTYSSGSASYCTPNDAAGTVACTFQKTSPACTSPLNVVVGSGLSVSSGPALSGSNWSFTISGASAANRTVTSITCPETTVTTFTSAGAGAGSSSTATTRASTLATAIIGKLSSTYWSGTSACSSGGGTTVSCTLVPASGSTCGDASPVVTNSGLTISQGGSSAGWTLSISSIDANDSVTNIACPSSTTYRAIVGNASTGTNTTTDTQIVQRLNNLKTGLNAINQSGYSFSCSTATNSSVQTACTMTGPIASGSFPTCSFNTSSTISPTDPTMTRTGGTLSNAGTSAQWTFDITNATADSKTIGAISCSSVDALGGQTANSGAGTALTDAQRVNNLGTYLASHAATNWTITQNTSATGSGAPPTTPATFTATGPGSSYACSWTQSTDPTITLSTPSAVAGTGTGNPSWTFDITNATADNLNFGGVTCGGTSILPSPTPNTGTDSSGIATRINHLTGSNGVNNGSSTSNSYTTTCNPATSAGTACTLVGPAGAAKCNTPGDGKFVISNPTGTITVGTVTRTAPGSDSGIAVEDFKPYITTASNFSGGYAAQGASTTALSVLGTIGTSPSPITFSSAVPSATLAVDSNTAGGRSGLTLNMAGGSDPDTSANHWSNVGIFKRVDIVPGTNSYSRGSARTDCTGATCTYAEELQNFANWYSYYRTRMQMMKSASTIAFSALDANYRVGFDNICQASGTTVKLGAAQFVNSGGETANQRTNWWSQLTSANPSCATPLRTETGKIGRYYAGKLSSTDPIQYSCQQNFMLLVTDGYWNESEPLTANISAGDIGNVDNSTATAGRPYYDGQQASTTCPGSGTRSSASSCRTLADIAWYYYSTDLRSTGFTNKCNGGLGNGCTDGSANDVSTNNVLTTDDDKNQAQHMVFYAMGLGIDGTLEYRSDYKTAGIGDFADIRAGNKDWPAVLNLDPTGVDDLWHATVNGRGKYFSARNLPNVVAGLREALTKIGSRVGSAAAAATSNLEPVAGDNFAYVASYATVDWTGDLQSRSIDVSTGDVSPDTNCSTAGSGCQWSAQSKLDNMTWSARRIYMAPTSNASGASLLAFTWPNLSAAQQAYFDPSSLSQYATLHVSNPGDITGSNLVDFLRGDRSLEQDGDLGHPQIWRQRAHVMGDVVDTQPIYMKVPNRTYTDTGYSAYTQTGTAAARRPVVFVSSQDGMVHAINADTGSVTMNGVTVAPGEELWSYIPQQAMASMKVLGDTNYALHHRYFIDGPIAVSDVDFGAPSTTDWHTILVAGDGAGGTSYFALDVTDPVNPKYLWEISPSTSGFSNLGYTFSNPTVAKLPNGEWAVFFASGYNNADNQGHLYAVNPQTGAMKSGYPLDTGSGTAGSPSNLGKIAVWVNDPAKDNTAQYIYAGGTDGDLWRFDLDPTAAGHTGTAVFKLAHFADSGGTAQPITTKPDLTTDSDGHHLVYVGTGKYLESSDLTTTAVQSFYALKDTLGAVNLSSSTSQDTWHPRTDTLLSDNTKKAFLARRFIENDENSNPITKTVNGVTTTYRKVCPGASSTVKADGTCNNVDSTTMDWSTYGGWYVDFPDSGERMNVDMKLTQGTLVFASNIPSATSCTVGGSAWGNFLDYKTGLQVENETTSSIKIADSLVVGITVIKLQSGQYKAIATKSNYQQETLAVPVAPSASTTTTSPFQNKRSLWREFEAY